MQSDAIVVAANFVEAGGARRDFDERSPIHMKENTFARDDDGGALLIPTGIALASGTRPAESEIIGAMRDSFFIETRLQFR